jgi:hypothetical protein
VSTEIITGITEIGGESGSHNKIEGQHPKATMPLEMTEIKGLTSTARR